MEWIGYTVDITNWKLGISERKMSWLKEWSKWAVFEESIGDRPMRPLSSWPSVLGELFRVDAMADLEGVVVGGWETWRPP